MGLHRALSPHVHWRPLRLSAIYQRRRRENGVAAVNPFRPKAALPPYRLAARNPAVSASSAVAKQISGIVRP
jgi:hypothetical protein